MFFTAQASQKIVRSGTYVDNQNYQKEIILVFLAKTDLSQFKNRPRTVLESCQNA
jgi:hypothetical protein